MASDEKNTTSSKKSTNIKDSLTQIAKKLGDSRVTRQGQIHLHLTDGADYCLDCKPGKTTVSEGSTRFAAGTPLIEVMGDASVISAILEGKKDALKQFAAGGLRIRGDMRYFSDLALELGIINTPL